jgi:DNA-binding phage protein
MARERFEEYRFREAFAAELRHYIERTGITQSELGRRLGITRQSVDSYIGRRSSPRADVVLRAITTLGIQLHFEGHSIEARGVSAGQAHEGYLSLVQQLPLDYFDAPALVEEDHPSSTSLVSAYNPRVEIG